ncbi:hypothetical protein BCR34DRAFT_592171 [Clohesyomyces aquaticus]|uniref:Uncharacterized protein n=1 Tax=Clohesyomyces aquaticus TaxID=1231657 RepID=A0A1Y1YUZ2_9PLEO|nr:hypothetical protein BCR34DRAFT_592171 [Clohesyomyces aquaticus]
MPFVCPQCIEDGLRAEFDRCIAEALKDGNSTLLVRYPALNNTQKDIETWTKPYVKDMIELYGMRPAQGLTGVFRMEKNAWRTRARSAECKKDEDPVTCTTAQPCGRTAGRSADLPITCKRGNGVQCGAQTCTYRDSRSRGSRSQSPDTLERDDESNEEEQRKKTKEKYRQRSPISRACRNKNAKRMRMWIALRRGFLISRLGSRLVIG